MISEPSEMRSRFQPIASITMATTPQHQRHRDGDDQAGAQAQAHQAHRHHDHERFHQRALEFPHGILHGGGLVGDALQLDAVRQLGLHLRDRVFHGLAELHDVAVVGHHDADHQHVLAVVADGVDRRVLEAALDRRDVAELDGPAAGGDRHVADVVQIRELAAHAHEDAVLAGVDRAAGHHRVLALQALGDGQRRDAERGQALVRELHVHLLLLLAQEVDLLHVGRLEQAALDVLGDVGQLGVADAVTLDGIEQRVDVAVLVVEDRADDAVGQFELEVGELLARLVPGFLLVACARCRPSR